MVVLPLPARLGDQASAAAWFQGSTYHIASWPPDVQGPYTQNSPLMVLCTCVPWYMFKLTLTAFVSLLQACTSLSCRVIPWGGFDMSVWLEVLQYPHHTSCTLHGARCSFRRWFSIPAAVQPE